MLKILPDDIANTLDLLQNFGLSISTESKKIICLHLIPNDFRLLSGDDKGQMQIWDKFTYSLILNLKSHLSRIYRITSISSLNLIFTCSEDSNIGIWNFQDYSLIKKIQTDYVPYCFKVVPDLQYIIVGCKWGYLCIYHLNSFKRTFLNKFCHKEIWHLDLDKTNTILILGTFDRDTIMINLNHLIKVSSYRSISAVTCVYISNQHNFAIIGQMNGDICVLSLLDCHLIRSIEKAHKDSIRDFLASADEEKAISASSDYCISIWKLKDFNKILNIRAHIAYVNCIVADWNKGILFSSAWDGTIKGIVIESGSVENEVKVHIGKIRSLFMDNKNNFIYSSDMCGCLKAWDLTEKKFMWNIHRESGFLGDRVAYFKKFLVVSNKMESVYVFKNQAIR